MRRRPPGTGRWGWWTGWCWFFCVGLAGTTLGHDTGSSYLKLTIANEQLLGRWEIAWHDLAEAFQARGLALDLRLPSQSVFEYAAGHLKIGLDERWQPLQIRAGEPLMVETAGGTNVILQFSMAHIGRPASLQVEYRLFFDLFPQHRGLVLLESHGHIQTAMLSPDHPAHSFQLRSPRPMAELLGFIREGVWHIWIGFDHILFLLALLLPSVLKREQKAWGSVDRFGLAFLNVFKIVTAFTIAHSITLSLATLQLIQLPARVVEPLIAASVLIAALNNLRPFFGGRAWLVAFGFGLVHGFGFATVLTELGMPEGTLVLSLLGFNAGVEIGQLAIVLVFLPLAYGVRESWVYQRVAMQAGSGLIALVATFWMIHRLGNGL